MPSKSRHWEILNIDFGCYLLLGQGKDLFLKDIFSPYDLNTPVISLSWVQ
jgi:hypothetical protein